MDFICVLQKKISSILYRIEIGMERPASKIIYTKLNEKIERVSKWSYIALVYIAFGGCGLCSLFVSYINYYIFDLKDESFLVPTPLMYVCVVQNILLALLYQY